MTDHDVFLSYSHADRKAATVLRAQLEQRSLKLFRDVESLRAGDLWLNELQSAVDACGSFVVLVGRDGVRRWVGAETQAALNRYFGPHDDAERLPIFPILLGDTDPGTLPAFLRLFQGTSWDGTGQLPASLLEQIRDRKITAGEISFEGCPFVGLDAYRPDQAQLFFGRQQETLDALACFDTRPGSPTVRWLEINGNSGSGKSSLMNAGLLPLVDQGWLWPHTGFETWRRIGPMMPGERPLAMLAEHLARAFEKEMSDVRRSLEDGDDRALAEWLRTRKSDHTAFLLAIDQFEELFTFADPTERGAFDRLLAAALEDVDCPLFVISTVRSDFLDRFEDLPRLVAVRNRLGKAWTLPVVSMAGLREIVSGPARLARLDVSEVQEVIIDEAQGEPGALPLVENALYWLWERRTPDGRLSGQLFTEQGGLAGILSQSADELLRAFGERRDQALELLFRLVKVDLEGRRHTRRRIPLADGVALAGGGEGGHDLVYRLAGARARDGGPAEGPLRLITVGGGAGGTTTADERDQWIDLIHETLVRTRTDAEGKQQPYWPTLWHYVERHQERAAWRERVRAETQSWLENDRKPSYLWSHERVREAATALTRVGPAVELSEDERVFLGPIDPGAMLAELEHPDTDHRRRSLIGERLDVFGDPRPGVGVDGEGIPRIAWRTVPGGGVVIQVERRVLGGTKPRPKQIDEFQIARYPITVAQYRAFLDAADGWRDPAWWAGDLYRDPEGDSFDVGRFGNHPAVYVSWFDAMAFCRWLSRRLNATIRLPDEWQWQQAATGGDPSRTYPWGEEDPKAEPHRANTFESRLGAATAVGMYPAGASPVDALDKAGTVYEWCLNKHGKPDVTESRSDDFDPRVVRGGSWYDFQGSARCAVRNRNLPDLRNNGIGFRVVSSSPI